MNFGLPAPAPCKECPFRRTAAPGWLGGNDLAAAPTYLAAAHSDRDINCHMVEERSCSGLAIYRRNICKQPRSGSGLMAVRTVAADRQTVFATPNEFLERHDTEANRRLYGGAQVAAE